MVKFKFHLYFFVERNDYCVAQLFVIIQCTVAQKQPARLPDKFSYESEKRRKTSIIRNYSWCRTWVDRT